MAPLNQNNKNPEKQILTTKYMVFLRQLQANVAHETICERGKLHSFISISMEDICGIYTEVHCKLETSAGKNQSRWYYVFKTITVLMQSSGHTYDLLKVNRFDNFTNMVREMISNFFAI